MASKQINKVVMTGNLTRDPELYTTPNGFAICSLRIANNTSRKEGDEWVDKPNYFDVKVLGKSGENAAKYLSKGRAVAIDGKLEWREYTKQNGDKGQAVEIIVDFNGTIEFLASRGESRDGAAASEPADVEPQADGAEAGGDEFPF